MLESTHRELNPQNTLNFELWGEVPYQLALDKQLKLLEDVKSGERSDTVIFCTHPPVVTLGRGSKGLNDQGYWSGETVEVSRGGRATYHGPNQLVIYPILNLDSQSGTYLLQKDVHSYLRSLEKIITDCLNKFHIDAIAKTVSPPDQPNLSMTGVWVGEKKIASIGVAIKSWITYHGISLNVDKDDKAFFGIQPCGFSPQIMTSMEDVLGKKIDRNHLIDQMKICFKNILYR